MRGIGGFTSQIRFNSKSTQGVVLMMIFRTITDADGTLNVVYLWSNDGSRKLNLNWTSNQWDSRVRVAGVRKLYNFKYRLIAGICLFV